jgi:pimeloyl-ACP methyl ester carboxylesterase
VGTFGIYASVPTVVLVGRRDRMTPPSHAILIAKQLPGTNLVIYPDSGHMLPLERATELSGHIRRLAEPAMVSPVAE